MKTLLFVYFMYLYLFLYSINISSVHSLVKYPIILIPGNGGSQLEVKLNKPSTVHYFCEKKSENYSNLWLTLSELVPYVIDCWLDNMRLIYDNVTRTTSNPIGVDIRVPGFANTSTIEFLDPAQLSITGYFNILVNALIKDIGYERSINLHGAPYDFRKAPNELSDFFLNLTKLIEDTHKKNKNKVLLICHSMGCLNTLYLLNTKTKSWKQDHIKSLITLASPWGGAVKSLKAFASGDNFGVIVIPSLRIRRDERTFPSLAYLLPNNKFWPEDDILIRTQTANYTTGNLNQFFNDINYTNGYDMWLDTRGLINDLKTPEVEVHCLYGLGIDTIEYLDYQETKFPDGSPKIKYGEGDGTVNEKSLRGCLKWEDKQEENVFLKSFLGVDHMSITADPKILEYIKSVAT